MTGIFKIRTSDWQTKGLFYALFLLWGVAGSPVLAGDLPTCDFRALSGYREEADRIKREHLYVGQDYLHRVSNQHFVDYAHSVIEVDGRLYLHVENAVLKTLNDKGFGDKEISAATLNLYKTLFFKRLGKVDLADVLTGIEIGGGYNDFKSVRLSFDTTAKFSKREIVEKIDALYRAVAEEFSEGMRDYQMLARAYRESGNPILKDPALWHEAGIGTTPAKANLKARLRRSADYRGRSGEGLVFDSNDVQKVAADLRRVERDRAELAKTFEDPRMFFHGLPTEELVDVLRIAETAPEVVTHQDYRDFVRQFLYRRFAVDVHDNTPIDRLQRYFHLGNELAPSIFTPYQEPMGLADLTKVKHGVWSLDLTGQNKRNLSGVFAALHFAAQSPKFDTVDYLVDRALEETTNRQAIESSRFFGFSNYAKQVMLSRGVILASDPNGAQGSGDDLIYSPSVELREPVRMLVLQDLANNPYQGCLFRSSIQSQNYRDGTLVPREERLELISKAESYEKLLRRRLEGSSLEGLIPENDLREIMISIAIHPIWHGVVSLDLEIVHRKGAILDARLARAVEKIKQLILQPGLLPAGWTVNQARTVEQVLDEAARAQPGS